MNLESIRQKTRLSFLLAASFFIAQALFYTMGAVVFYMANAQFGIALPPFAITCLMGLAHVGLYVVFSLWLRLDKPNPAVITIAAVFIGIRFLYDTIRFFRGILSTSPAAGTPLYMHIVNYAPAVLGLVSALLLLLLLLKKQTGTAFIVCEALIAAFGAVSFVQALTQSFGYTSALQKAIPVFFFLTTLVSGAARIALAYGCMNLFFKKKEAAAENAGSSADEIRTDISI